MPSLGKVDKNGLDKRQKKFCQLFIKYGNITKAAIEAGYSEKTAHVQGSRLLTKVKIQEYIAKIGRGEEKEEEKRIADAQEVMEYFTSVMRGEVNDQFDLEPALSDRTRAAQELAKRMVDTKPVEARVTIVNDLPRSNK